MEGRTMKTAYEWAVEAKKEVLGNFGKPWTECVGKVIEMALREARIEGAKAMQENAANLCENEAQLHLSDAESLSPTRARRGRAMMGGPLRCAKAIRAIPVSIAN